MNKRNPHESTVEAESQLVLNFVLAEVQKIHPGSTVADYPGVAIEAMCVLVAGALAKNRELETRLAEWLGGGPQ